LMAPEVGSVDTLAIKHSITRRAGKTKRAHHHESPRGHASLCPPYMLIGADLTPKQCSELLPSPLWGGVGGHERRHSIATTSQPPAPTPPNGGGGGEGLPRLAVRHRTDVGGAVTRLDAHITHRHFAVLHRRGCLHERRRQFIMPGNRPEAARALSAGE